MYPDSPVTYSQDDIDDLLEQIKGLNEYIKELELELKYIVTNKVIFNFEV